MTKICFGALANLAVYNFTFRYWFSCECPACKEDWPLLKENKKVKKLDLNYVDKG